MEPYITFREQDESGELRYYILQKEFPHILGVIVTFPDKKIFTPQPIAAYNLWVDFSGTLRGNMLPSYKDVLNEVHLCLQSMAEYFLKERILKTPNRYSKFKINANGKKD